jgi:hypothetical protein
MAIWAWMQPVEKIWKVVSDAEKGTILVYNEKSDLIMEKKGLSVESVSLIEKYFLEIVATRMTAVKPCNMEAMNLKKPVAEFNYMYA